MILSFSGTKLPLMDANGNIKEPIYKQSPGCQIGNPVIMKCIGVLSAPACINSIYLSCQAI